MRDDKGDVPWWATWLGKVFCNMVEMEVMCTMGAMAALATLVFLGSFFMLVHVDTQVVVLGKGFATSGALKRMQSIKEVDMLVKADVVLLGSMVIALGTFVRFFSCVSLHVNVDFSLVTEHFGALGIVGSSWAFDWHYWLMGAVYEMGAEVVLVNQMVAEGTITGVMTWVAVTAVDMGYGAELDVIQSFITVSEDGATEGIGVRWGIRQFV